MVAFAVSLSYRLLYITLAEVLQIADAMRLKGLELNWKKPFRFVANVPKLLLPVLFTVVRRGPTLIAALEMRGFTRKTRLDRLDLGDVVLLGIGLIIVGYTVLDRFNLLPAMPLLG